MVSFILVGVILATSVVHDAAGQFGCLSNTTCNGNGYCRDPINCASTCICNGGYTGSFCTNPPICSDTGVQCATNGDCVNYRCVCKNKYTGTLCEKPPVCTVTGNECGMYGECNNCSSTVNFCQCNKGYGGDTCNIAPVCTEGGNECKNGGVCNFLTNPYNCTCPPEYDVLGDTCGAHHLAYFMTSLVLPLIGSFMLR